MGIQANTLTGEQHTFTWVRGKDTCEITYLAGTMSGADIKEKVTSARAGTTDGDPSGQEAVVDMTLELLSDILVTWEVLDADGSMYPTDVEALSILPFSFCLQALEACQKDMVDSVGGSARLLSRAIATEGKAGEVPDWYIRLRTAERLRVAPWELDDVPLIWVLRTQAAIDAEATSREDHYTPR